ncbi:hypothetical protein LCGC14_0988570 [marine sediment metagenome]|uniref:Uncharacterized protein n=1 Tax=marine sediment metagenome TaxID=412755 RepID=A0A0F9RD11_9ZZZZ
MVSLASKNVQRVIDEERKLAERFIYMTQPYYTDDLHKTIKYWIDEAVFNPETDTSKLTAMIIAEVNNGG